MLIIDLDDTIFHTQSMNPKIFDPAISVIKNYYDSNELIVKGDELIAELWLRPTDDVFSEYGTPKEIVAKFYQAIAKIDFNELDIQAFDDYKAIAFISLRKVLVTTGLRELQWAKIKALGIESDFEAIYIDDPRDQPRRHKINIFKQILKEIQKAPEEIWVIGDNPESEIKAGKALKMNTIQRKSPSKQSSKYADYEIDTFEELKKIIKLRVDTYSKIINMKNIFLISSFFIGCFSAAYAQLDVLKVQVESLASYQFTPYVDEEEKLDSMYRATGKNLMKILDEREITEKDEVKGLYSLSSEDGRLKIYTFLRLVNGTMGGFYCSVAQWTKPDGTYGTFPLYRAGKKKFLGVHPRFYSIKKLRSKNKDLYLLMGRARASGSVTVGVALVVQLKGQYLILDYPAFYRESSVLSYLDGGRRGRVPMEYDEHQQVLKLMHVEKWDDIHIISDLKYKEITDIMPTPELLFYFDGNTFHVN